MSSRPPIPIEKLLLPAVVTLAVIALSFLGISPLIVIPLGVVVLLWLSWTFASHYMGSTKDGDS